MILYYKGCTASEKIPEIADATEYILKKAGIKYHTLENEPCCGSVLLRTGFHDAAIQQMKENINFLKDYQNETILTSCAGCYKTLKNDYKEKLNTEFNVIHISQLLNQLIKEGKISPEKNDIKVTYHDPCHLCRHAGESEAPREVIKSSADLVEMKHNREDALCCGSGGGVKSAYNDMSNEIAKNRMKEAEESGAELLVTACPFCKLNLNDNSDMEVLDLSEFICTNLKKQEEEDM
ncbi:MAG: heterodisulfide reductase-related iron-sulfur binding cluster [Methanobacteriaceae archaeon]|jgi:Fe-S oxidoreductase|uniref:(Fe-S)-binding protein n=1 Tax=Methanobrevibacter TaxID=2172 RepID=UPI002A11E1C5|nr:heterodisulfide reductase-related iron-sulfur binding cluster [Methanobacteriaceae archaeon]MDD3409040.1 heterodisulfide reductase-related iron-sulfur binding cluster [Methanobacteriaceae archaeon]MDD4594587.1 heterodisulfide reductase-related iron-sulfur binding cluster [Methanobacteriaceae archaeon]